jgi:hypothetical protein
VAGPEERLIRSTSGTGLTDDILGESGSTSVVKPSGMTGIPWAYDWPSRLGSWTLDVHHEGCNCWDCVLALHSWAAETHARLRVRPKPEWF